MHRVFIAAGEANFEFRIRRATGGERRAERAQDEPAMQRRRAFRAQRRNEPRLYASRFGKTREQNQSAPAAAHILGEHTAICAARRAGGSSG